MAVSGGPPRGMELWERHRYKRRHQVGPIILRAITCRPHSREDDEHHALVI